MGLDKNLATRWFEEVWNKGRRDAIAEMMAPNAVLYDAGDAVRGPEGFYPFFDRLQASFSDMHFIIQDTITEGDKICARWTCSMKHTGDGLGLPATGKSLEITGISVVRVAGDQFVEGWQNWDMLGLMQQIEGSQKPATYIATA